MSIALGRTPKLSIITVTLNCNSTIRRTLFSIASQCYVNVEHIVVDGGSKDGTIETLNHNRGNIDKLIIDTDYGIYDALNKGLRACTGDVVGILHGDDVYADSDVLLGVASLFYENPSVDIIYGDAMFFRTPSSRHPTRYSKGRYFSTWMMRFGFMPPHTATFVRTAVFKKIGTYDKTYKSAGDFEFLLRVFCKHRLKSLYWNKTAVYMTQGGLSTSGLGSIRRTTDEMSRALADHGIYSNYFFLGLRLPIKLITEVLFRKRSCLR